jgi:hypothetical protein
MMSGQSEGTPDQNIVCASSIAVRGIALTITSPNATSILYIIQFYEFPDSVNSTTSLEWTGIAIAGDDLAASRECVMCECKSK